MGRAAQAAEELTGGAGALGWVACQLGEHVPSTWTYAAMVGARAPVCLRCGDELVREVEHGE